ncbi:hypothetical protein [uncultured Aquimarina sp.]|uniref:hypothetical protein n=1 Tax=uncultured Aquimarina sp. TaxID=575652 RepID=UPI00262ECFA9|nr:hypothetical protein [uncultured Aquimarina sp.]
MNKISLLILVILVMACNNSSDYVLSDENPPINKERKAQIISAFFGLDNSLPLISAGLWKEAPGQDGMPLVFSHEIDPNTLDAHDFLITTANGEKMQVDFVTLKPASEAFELRTVLLIGEYGNAPENEPVEVEIIGELQSRDGQEMQGQKIEVTPLSDGPFISYAEHFVIDEVYPYNNEKKGCDCPKDETTTIVRTVWAGGVVATNGEELGIDQLENFTITLRRDKTSIKVKPFLIADLNDNDNNIDLCIKEKGTPIRVEVDEHIVIDPNQDKNPKTSSEIVSRW